MAVGCRTQETVLSIPQHSEPSDGKHDLTESRNKCAVCDPQYATRPRTEGEFTSQAAPPPLLHGSIRVRASISLTLTTKGCSFPPNTATTVLRTSDRGRQSSRANHCLAVGEGTSPTPSADRLTHSGQSGLRLPFPPWQSCEAARARTPWGSKPSSERHTAELRRRAALHSRRHVPTRAQACLCGSHPSAHSVWVLTPDWGLKPRAHNYHERQCQPRMTEKHPPVQVSLERKTRSYT